MIFQRRVMRSVVVGAVVFILLLDVFYAYLRTDIRVGITLSVDQEAAFNVERQSKKPTVTSDQESKDSELDHQQNADETLNKRPYRIPRILHQFWDTERVPTVFIEWIQSWNRFHPDWVYFFWTDSDVQRLLSKHYPEHLETYMSYPGMLHRANAMRYYVLHQYGGVYADLDVEVLRPMDIWLEGPQDCFLSLENYEHAYFHYQAEEPVVMNTLMACRPRHPFYVMVLDMLQVSRHIRDTLHSNGPFFLNHIYKSYHSTSPTSPVLAVQPMYFLPTFDPVLLDKIQKSCRYTHLMSYKEKSVCRELAASRWRNKPSSEAFTDHHWVHVNHKDDEWKERSVIHIKHLIPNTKDLKQMLSNDVL